jgi:hypothetical protein
MRINWYLILQTILAALAVAAFLVCFGCSPKVQPSLRPTTDSTRVHYEIKYDSIFIDRWHTIKEKGDTIFVHDSIFIEKWREKHTRDTLCVRDSVPYEVPKYIRQRNGYDRFTARGFWIMIALAIGYIALRIFLRFKGIK